MTQEDAWTSRVRGFESLLAQKGRSDLLPPVSLVATLLGKRDRAADPATVLALVGRVLTDVRACVAERGRRVPTSLMIEVERAIEAIDSASGRMSERPDKPDAWAAGLLEDLGAADDQDLEALAGAIRAAEKLSPKDELGTLTEPLRRANGEKGTAPRVLMKGELHPGLLADLIQLFAQNGETGLLFIEGKEISASVYFKDGVITDALCAEDQGEKGFFRAMHIREGRFSYQRGVEAEAVRIYRTAQHLIMDTLRMMDEAS